ncbi:hypothetical protein TRFO_04360 [Tritrichomonas foetus]|uniref:Uncharacterized protein n=1 Tax=Tritrichomonas foetus TaxID=1144522 RepID=A0A1J4KF88_9EUKA|nr:hypothetical protein TRFO_04360 [Tritrichomonas foetus]|eukprot:OHT09843.1 hypothetical protein TRFO_04360 [Tritrichomonas foetus]
MSILPYAEKMIVDASSVQTPVAKNLEALRKFDAQLRNSFKIQIERNKKYRPPKPTSVIVHFRPLMRVLTAYLEEIQENYFENIKKNTKTVVEGNIALIQFLQANTDKTVNPDQYVKASINYMQSTPEIKKFTWLKVAVENKVTALVKAHGSKNINKMAVVTLKQAFTKFDEKEKYIPVNPFESVLPHYLNNSPKYSKMIDSIVEQITQQSVQSSMVTIAELTDSIKDSLLDKKEAEGHRFVVYYALVRYLFSQAYIERPILAANGKANLLFLEKCQIFQKATVGSLALPASIKKTCPANAPVRTIFREPHMKALNAISFLTNPIDIMIRINRARILITKFFNDVAEKDVKILFTILIALNPPLNAISIALFLQKWGDMKMNNMMAISKDMFVAGVQLIYQLDDEDEYEEEEDENEE